ncbi:MAG: class I SAM-dependent methyltransferase [Pseudomonadota bacterium]
MKQSVRPLEALSPVAGSFRDPKGQVARGASGDVFRLITKAGNADFSTVEETGLYDHLITLNKLVGHQRTVPWEQIEGADVETLLRHPELPMITYPYEWCFQQMKEAALLQLDLYLESLDFDVTLSDATAFNVQFVKGKPIFIDTLSFVPYTEGQFWAGQEQFTEQFLNPLLLTALSGVPFNDVYRGSMAGVSSELISAITPFHRKISWRYFNYIHLPMQSKKRSLKSGAAGVRKIDGKLPKEGFKFILKQLRGWVASLSAPVKPSTWIAYTNTRIYEDQSVAQKVKFVAEAVEQARPKQLLDLGCNTGEFSFLALDAGASHVVGLESDHQALSTAYAQAAEKEARFLPIYQNITNPSPSQGWANEERDDITERVNADFLLALAILHHVIISGNIPLERAVSYLAKSAPEGVVEWVPKSDPMVQTLLRNRDDIFENYSKDSFERALGDNGLAISKTQDLENGRTLYLYEKTK